jgi:proline iminopeptidase
VADPSTLSLETHVADLEALRRHFRLGRLALLAHSGGAAIALRYTERHPAHVARVLLVAPLPPARAPYGEETARAFAPRLDSTTRARAATLQASLPTARDPRAVCRAIASMVIPRAFFADPAAAARMRGDFCTGSPEAMRTQPERLAAFQRSLPPDWRPIVSGIRAPVLILHGDHDAIPVAAAEAWVRVLPDARLLVITRADHLPWVEQPGRFFAAASEFFAGRWPAGATIAR